MRIATSGQRHCAAGAGLRTCTYSTASRLCSSCTVFSSAGRLRTSSPRPTSCRHKVHRHQMQALTGAHAQLTDVLFLRACSCNDVQPLVHNEESARNRTTSQRRSREQHRL